MAKVFKYLITAFLVMAGLSFILAILPYWFGIGYRVDLSYATSGSQRLVKTTLVHEQTGTRAVFKYPRAAGRDAASIRGDGQYGSIKLILSWPELEPLGKTKEHTLGRKVDYGDYSLSHPGSVWIYIKSRVYRGRTFFSPLCPRGQGRGVLDEKPLGLYAISDDRFLNQTRRMNDGTYRANRDFLPYPLNVANKFIDLADPVSNSTYMHCTSLVYCSMTFSYHGWLIEVSFDTFDLENWRDYREAVEAYLDRITTQPPGMPEEWRQRTTKTEQAQAERACILSLDSGAEKSEQPK